VFHTHGTRNGQKFYVGIIREGGYFEKDDWESDARSYPLTAADTLKTVRGRGDAFHSVLNTSDSLLVIFVITTNELYSKSHHIYQYTSLMQSSI